MDIIYRTLICGGQVSLTVLETTGLVNEAVKVHKTQPDASKTLGEMLTCGAYLSSCLKEESGCVSLTVKAKTGDGAVSVSGDKALHLRGYADGSCTQTLAGGSLTVVREDGFSRPFVGSCGITSNDASDILETYFQQSEQIPTAVALRVLFNGDGKCAFAGGVVMQLLPDASEENTALAGEAFEKYKSASAENFKSARQILKQFAPLICGEITELHPQYKCNCSEAKIKGTLAAVGREELLNILDELGEVRVHCHYCNRDYVYDKEGIEEIFGR